MIDFPDSPTNGQQFTSGGVTWQYDGVKWVALGGGSAMAPIANPVFTGDPQCPLAPVGDNDTSLANTQFVTRAVANLNAPSNVGRNVIQNCTFLVQQRGTGGWSADGNYTADRWQMQIGSPSTMTVSVIGLVDADRTAIGDEQAAAALRHVFTGSTGYCAIVQKIEQLRRFSGKRLIFSFWARCASGTVTPEIVLWGSYGSGGSTSSRNSLGTVTITTTWTRFTVSGTIASASGMTFGSGDSLWATFYWSQSGGPVNSGTVDIWGVQCEVAQSASQTLPSPLEKIPYDDDLRHCMRFYYQGVPPLRGVVTSATGIGRLACPHPVAMRAVPTFAIVTPLPVYDGSAVSTITGGATGAVTTTVLEFDATGCSGLTAGRVGLVYQNAGGLMTVSADL